MIPHERAKATERSRSQGPPDDGWAESIVQRVLASCHPKQRAFVEDRGRRISAIVGRGGGKTTGAMARLICRMVRNPRARCVFIATTKDHAADLIWEQLKDTLQRLGVEAKFNETKLTCTLKKNGARLKLTGADDKKEIDKLRGQSFHEVCIDEAASHEHRLLEWLIKRVCGPRMGQFKGSIVLFGTPGHDLRGLFYDATAPSGVHRRFYADRNAPEYDPSRGESEPFRDGIDPRTGEWLRWSFHKWTVFDGAPYIPALKAELEEHLRDKAENQWSDDNPVWRREYLGEWAADDTEMMFRFRPVLTGDAARDRGLPDGTPWNTWDPPRVGAHRFAKLPLDADGKERTDWLYAYGFDMGHSDPFAVTVFAFAPSDPTRTIYHVFGLEKPKMYARPIAQLLLGADESRPNGCCPHESPEGLLKSTGWPIGMVSDMTHMGPLVLEELLKVYGVQIGPAEQKAKFAAIELFNGDLVDGRIKVLKGSTLEQQLSSLQWQPDEFGRLREPKGAANHSVDSAIYARRLIAHLFDTEIVTAHVNPTNAIRQELDQAFGQDIEQLDSVLHEPDWNDLYR